MYNLIVMGAGWNPHSDSIDSSRVFEYTDSVLLQRYLTNNTVNLDSVSKLPTLFMAETQGSGDQVAHVGSITQLKLVGRTYQIEYVLDPRIPAISNRSLEKIASELNIDDFEFSRTHWAIKNVDLYKILLRNTNKGRPSPKVFNFPDKPVDSDLISVMMPFDQKFTGVYDSLLAAAKTLNKDCRRADNIWNHDAIIEDVVALIYTSRIVICDLTGKNANVFYEAGIAHSLGKDVILITQSEEDVPFDLKHLRFIKYLNNGEGLVALTEEVEKRMQTLLDQ